MAQKRKRGAVSPTRDGKRIKAAGYSGVAQEVLKAKVDVNSGERAAGAETTRSQTAKATGVMAHKSAKHPLRKTIAPVSEVSRMASRSSSRISNLRASRMEAEFSPSQRAKSSSSGPTQSHISGNRSALPHHEQSAPNAAVALKSLLNMELKPGTLVRRPPGPSGPSMDASSSAPKSRATPKYELLDENSLRGRCQRFPKVADIRARAIWVAEEILRGPDEELNKKSLPRSTGKASRKVSDIEKSPEQLAKEEEDREIDRKRKAAWRDLVDLFGSLDQLVSCRASVNNRAKEIYGLDPSEEKANFMIKDFEKRWLKKLAELRKGATKFEEVGFQISVQYFSEKVVPIYLSPLPGDPEQSVNIMAQMLLYTLIDANSDAKGTAEYGLVGLRTYRYFELMPENPHIEKDLKAALEKIRSDDVIMDAVKKGYTTHENEQMLRVASEYTLEKLNGSTKSIQASISHPSLTTAANDNAESGLDAADSEIVELRIHSERFEEVDVDIPFSYDTLVISGLADTEEDWDDWVFVDWERVIDEDNATPIEDRYDCGYRVVAAVGQAADQESEDGEGAPGYFQIEECENESYNSQGAGYDENEEYERGSYDSQGTGYDENEEDEHGSQNSQSKGNGEDEEDVYWSCGSQAMGDDEEQEGEQGRALEEGFEKGGSKPLMYDGSDGHETSMRLRGGGTDTGNPCSQAIDMVKVLKNLKKILMDIAEDEAGMNNYVTPYGLPKPAGTLLHHLEMTSYDPNKHDIPEADRTQATENDVGTDAENENAVLNPLSGWIGPEIPTDQVANNLLAFANKCLSESDEEEDLFLTEEEFNQYASPLADRDVMAIIARVITQLKVSVDKGEPTHTVNDFWRQTPLGFRSRKERVTAIQRLFVQAGARINLILSKDEAKATSELYRQLSNRAYRYPSTSGSIKPINTAAYGPAAPLNQQNLHYFNTGYQSPQAWNTNKQRVHQKDGASYEYPERPVTPLLTANMEPLSSLPGVHYRGRSRQERRLIAAYGFPPLPTYNNAADDAE